jgi:hypothetical protein
MSEPTASLRTILHHLAQILREAHHLGPEAQRQLADLIDELGEALDASPAAPAELGRLSEATASLAEALKTRDQGMLTAVRDRLQGAAVEAEVQAPLTVGLVRRIAETLANIGI